MHFVTMCIFFLSPNIKGGGSVCDSSYYQIWICKKGVKWYFCILALGFCSGLSHATDGWLNFDLLVGLVFSFSLKCVQFLQEELSLSHLHMLSHTCFCPGGLPCCFFPPDIPHHLVCSCPFWLLWQCSVCMWVLSWGGASVAAPACSLVCSLFLCPTDPAEGQSGQPQVNDAPVALEESDGRRVWDQHPVQLLRFAP